MNCLEKKKHSQDIISVEDLLSSTKYGQNCFRIPDYQRGYAWDSQFVDLWNDIIRLYNNSLDQQHYTGMLSLEEMSLEEKKHENLEGCNAFYVVDGQQRLTSIVIIIKAIIDYIKSESNEIVDNDYLSFDRDFYRFDYSVDRKDELKNYLKQRIYLSDNTALLSDMYLKNINNARVFIDSKLIQYDVQQSKKILNIVLKQLVFNVYFIDEKFDVRVTFETMNNRGKKLSNLELLKNRLMYLTTFLGKNRGGSDSKANVLKNKINDAWMKIYNNLCYRDYQLNDDEYLQAHWIVYGSLDKSKGDSYIRDILNKKFSVDGEEFALFIKEKQYSKAYDFIANYVDSLANYSQVWGSINNPLDPKKNIKK